MTDRELLELAAKAAGNIEYFWTENGNLVLSDPDGKRWNPLTDDGDALRLAVALNMGISIPVFTVFNKHRADVISFRNALANAIEEGNDPYATTRRAIVRVAAAIGEQMK